MARPQKKRFVCRIPKQTSFGPDIFSADEIILSVDEYEAIRLIDLEDNTQEECSRQMQVSRTTVQSIYTDARRKLADAIVNGKRLIITGGDYQLCNFYEKQCGSGCGRQCHRFETIPAAEMTDSKDSIEYLSNVFQKQAAEFSGGKEYSIEEGGKQMKIAVTYENGQIFQHFGHTQQFKIYTVEDGKITDTQVVDTMGSGHGALGAFLTDLGVDTLVCGGIGGGAQMALRQAGIVFYGGVNGSADEAVEALIANQLQYNPNVKCNHHDHEHGEGEHTCGSHGCGSHSCH